MNLRLLSLGFALMIPFSVNAAELPHPSDNDPRVRYITYKKDEVVTLNVRRGVVTRIVLDPEEEITAAATGFTATCGSDGKETNDTEWCIRHDKGTHQVWVKPKEGATHNNLELSTTKRDYSFEFRVLKDDEKGRWEAANGKKGLVSEPMYRVIFRYTIPHEQLLGILLNGGTRTPDEQAIVNERLGKKPVAKNWKYTMQVMEGAADIAPTLIFDDGVFTYFKFPNNREIPSIFMISQTGEESRVNVHMEGDLAVVEKMGRQFVLRLSQAVVGVWNENFDVDGVAASEGVTISGVKRVVK